MRIGVVFLDVQITFTIKKAIQNERRITVATLMRQAEIRGKVVRDKVVNLERDLV